jgi:hypothetical protein
MESFPRPEGYLQGILRRLRERVEENLELAKLNPQFFQEGVRDMAKKATKSKVKKSEQSDELKQVVEEGQEREALEASYRPQIDLAARAAVRAAGMMREAFRVRERLAGALAETSKSVEKTSSEILKGKYCPSSEQLEISEKIFDLALVDTRSVRHSLGYFTAQVNALDVVCKVARRGNAIAAFRALRGVSRAILTDANEEIRSLWRYVCMVWRQFDAEGPKVALWQPQLDATREERFKFDEATGTWRHVKDDGSEVAFDVKTSFAGGAGT